MIAYLRYIVAFVLSLSASVVLADNGVFNAKVTPDEAPIGAPQELTFMAEVPSGNHALYPASVAVYQTTSSGQPIANMGHMYDDGTHGDPVAADTIFTTRVQLSPASTGTLYFRITAAYQGERNRYMSPVLPVIFYTPLPTNVVDETVVALQTLESHFVAYMATNDIPTARQLILVEAQSNPKITASQLSGRSLCILYSNMVQGVAFLNDPSMHIDAGGGVTLPTSYQSPGNNKVLIFAPGYDSTDPQRGIADHAQSRFGTSARMDFTPSPLGITTDQAAGLSSVSQWGSYGTVVIHTHGGFWSLSGQEYVFLQTGTPASLLNQLLWMADLVFDRIAVTSDGYFVIAPSFVTKHCLTMPNTFFYLGACESLKNDSMWSALQAKGAKVAFGWSDTVQRSFNESTFATLIDPMLPSDLNAAPLTAQQAFDSIANKCDSSGPPACLQIRVAATEWQNFLFYPGGIINGNFESGDWTGWTHGGDYDAYAEVVSSRVHAGNFAGAIGRWDAAFTGYDPTLEPFGTEWFYQDFVVPNNATFLKFDWWQEGYDTANWDWFDASLMTTNGQTLQTLMFHGGKPGLNFGPYWNTATLSPVSFPSGAPGFGVEGGWYEVSADVSAYRGQKIRIYFDQRLDGYGDQTRTYIDDVRLE